MLFQTEHSMYGEEFELSRGNGIDYPLHLHRSFEYFLQIKGKSQITVDGKTYMLSGGDAVLIFPFQVHSYQIIELGEYEIGFFAPELVAEFRKKADRLIPCDNLFFFNAYCNTEPENIFLKKAHCYRICGEFDRGRAYAPKNDNLSDDIIKSLLLFVESNFRNECSLKSAASAIGYDYAYVSKYFKRKTGIPFKKYVNIMRINQSRQLLRGTSKSVLEIAEECGFSCPRTFGREFIGIVGTTPSEYRKKRG